MKNEMSKIYSTTWAYGDPNKVPESVYPSIEKMMEARIEETKYSAEIKSKSKRH